MIIKKPKFWDKKLNIFSLLFFPLSLVFLIVVFIRKKLIKPTDCGIPIICIGNIYVGGTGKTPASILLSKELIKLGHKTAILRKYYKSHKDEYDLIRSNSCNLILDKSRIEGVEIGKKRNYKIIILDDGFQDYKIQKNLNIICFNSNQLVGNGFVFPSGPLRETLSSLKKAHIILINGKKNEEFEKRILNINKKLIFFYSRYKPVNLDQFKNKKLLAIAAIGNPENFFNLMDQYGLNVVKKFIYPDHYKFSQGEVKNIIKEAEKNNYQIIVTEKDYFKFKNYESNKFESLKLSLEIDRFKDFIKLVEARC